MDAYTYKLEDYIRVAKERWKIILLVTLLTVGAAMVVAPTRSSDLAPTSAEATPIADEPTSDPTQDTSTPTAETSPIVVRIFPLISDPEQASVVNAEAERLLVLSDQVLRPVAKRLGVDIERLSSVLSVSVIPDADSLGISAQGVGGATGPQIARSAARSYLSHRSMLMQKSFQTALRAVETELGALRRYAGTETELVSLRTAALETERARLRSMKASARAGELLESSSYPTLLSPTAPATEPPASPEPIPTASPESGGLPRDLAAGFVLGILLGYGLALLIDILSPRFRSPREVQESLGLPILTNVAVAGFESAVGELTAQIESSVSGATKRSLAWIEVRGANGRRLFDAVVGLLRAGGSEIKPVDAAQMERSSRAQAEGFLKNLDQQEVTLVRAPADAPPGSSLTWGAACASALVAVDPLATTRAEAEQEVATLRRAGTEPLGVVLLARSK